MSGRVLVAGIGNVFLGDDGFGVEVARRLSGAPLPDEVTVVDFGIRGVHLAFELADPKYDAAILVDAVPRGGAPGTLYVIEPGGDEAPGLVPDAHSLTPDAVLAWVRRIGAEPAKVTIVGCEPGSIDASVGLTPPVAAAVDGAVAMIRRLMGERNGLPCV